MANDQPDHLARLVEFLNCDWMRIFIHIDRKVDAVGLRKRLSEQKSVIILDDISRIRVVWGAFSLVKATLNLLDAGLKSGERFDRFCLLSGSDFPIKTLNQIKAGFDSEKEYMRVDSRLDVSDNNPYCRNVRYFYFRDSLLFRATGRSPRISRKTYDKISLYKGSQFWALTEGCVKYITGFLQRNPDYIKFHRYTKCPDEIFFHSIVKSSPFAANITHDFEKVDDLKSYFAFNEHGCHYIDWNAKGITLPKVLDESDTQNLLDSEALFARKFRIGASGNLLQHIGKVIGANR